MKGIISPSQAAKKVKDGMSVMVGGFMVVGSPTTIIDAMVEEGTRDLTLIVNDTGFPDCGVGKLVGADQLKKVIVSHIGTNKITGEKMNNKEIEVELVPQGTLAEQIRAGGSGLGGVLTPTGIGTVVQEGKRVINVDGQDYILATPLRADVALLKAHKADRAGNLVFRRAARNFNPLMATAADLVIAEVDEVLEVGEIDPDEVVTPGIFVDYLVLGEVGKDG